LTEVPDNVDLNGKAAKVLGINDPQTPAPSLKKGKRDKEERTKGIRLGERMFLRPSM
jgi:hypothetical protein